jgi:hypothetical protein
MLQHNSYSSLLTNAAPTQQLLLTNAAPTQQLLLTNAAPTQQLLLTKAVPTQQLLLTNAALTQQLLLTKAAPTQQLLLTNAAPKHQLLFSQILHVPSKYCFLSDAASTRASFFFSYIELLVFLLLIHRCCCSTCRGDFTASPYCLFFTENIAQLPRSSTILLDIFLSGSSPLTSEHFHSHHAANLSH